jgi:hypothetical protein
MVCFVLLLVPSVAGAQLTTGPVLQPSLRTGPTIRTIDPTIPTLRPGLLLHIPSYKVEFDLPEGKSLEELDQMMPSSVPLYRTIPNVEAAAAMGAKLGSMWGVGNKFQDAEDEKGVRQIMEGSILIEQRDAAGSLFAGDMSRLWAEPPSAGMQGILLNERAAREKAESFLKMISAPLPGQYEVQVSYDNMKILQGGEEKTLPGPPQVSMRPVLGGIPTVGPGGKLKVFFDAKGEPAGCFVVARHHMKTNQELKLRALGDAARSFRLGDALEGLTLTIPDTIVVQDISLGYFAKGALESQEQLIPVYVFSGVARGTAGDHSWQVPYEQYVQAAPEVQELLWTPDSVIEAGPRIKLQIPLDQDE